MTTDYIKGCLGCGRTDVKLDKLNIFCSSCGSKFISRLQEVDK